MKQAMIDTMLKPKFDDLYTPEEGVYPLVKYLPKIKTIWECCDCGKSGITRVLKTDGWNVVSTDVKTGFDFLKDEPDFEFDIIVTNPPYSLKDDFIQRCYYHGKPFALLLPLTALEGIARGKMFRRGLSLIVLDKRLNFMTNKKSVWFNTSWFTHGIFDDSRLIFEAVGLMGETAKN